MRERPIIFSGAMVRAILDGRKTQTRRIAPIERVFEYDGAFEGYILGRRVRWGALGLARDLSACPYGQPGSKLWVRETWGDADRYYQGHENDCPGVIVYRADGAAIQFNARKPTPVPERDARSWNLETQRWRPSIYMPRWASRITLEMTAVRVERLQDISEDDALAEGVAIPPVVSDEVDRGNGHGYFEPSETHAGMFQKLWDSINGARAPWASNPWVWVLQFRRVDA